MSGQLWRDGEFAHLAGITARMLDDYVQQSQRGAAPVVCRTPPPAVIEHLRLREWIREGGMDETSWRAFLAAYLDRGTRLHHPGYLAHQCAVPDVGAALADLVHGVTNNAMSLYEMGAAGAATELVVVEWLLAALGWAEDGAGVLVHGGSLANLTALLCARAHAFPAAWEEGTPRDAVVLAPENAHVSVTRGAAILGLGSRAVVPLPADELGRVRGDLVGTAIDRERRAGRPVLAVVANACAAPTGLYDPVRQLADACAERDVWLHVDAAHGGGALLVPELRHLLDGAELGDSLTWDAHRCCGPRRWPRPYSCAVATTWPPRSSSRPTTCSSMATALDRT